MHLTGRSFIAGRSAEGAKERFRATGAATGEAFGPDFLIATAEEVDAAAQQAAAALAEFRRVPSAQRAAFLEQVAAGIEALGDELLQLCHHETGLPLARLTGERGRTCGQLRLFAGLVREGSWVDARIDLAMPQRTPAPRPDLRRMLAPLGPVAVFGASNFPLAFSVAGGDTASAWAAGCPVVVKAHPAHPGTSELVATAVNRAVEACQLPAGVFSLLHGGPETGLTLVRHPAIQAVGFTGSHGAGRALCDAAAARPHPIPVFAEMSSVNPLVILPGALEERSAALADALAGSVTLGVGQFCTKPGLIFVPAGPLGDRFVAELSGRLDQIVPGVMLTPGILSRFEAACGEAKLAAGDPEPGPAAPSNRAAAGLATVSVGRFLERPELAREVFGPYCLAIRYGSEDELAGCVDHLEGQLTGTVHFGAAESAAAAKWFALLEGKCGRLIANGFPTGVEVSAAMQHGGPSPSTSDPRFTSVGTAAIFRFARPVCYQSLPAALLPRELQDANPLGLLRLVNGVPTRDPVDA